ncbi:MAG: FprA family A-type flavoprotein [candidate division WOR-3 bacterium]|nr:FprA family A-type flavoprotein [candidate division WOR-3 bacterium]
MPIRIIKPDIYAIGTIDWDRRLFDELIPLPDGTSYNAYFIKGKDKTCLIDSSDPRQEQEFINNLRALNIKHIDYIISHHAEQDHSGAIPRVLELYPSAQVVTSPKGKTMLMDLLLIPEHRIMTIDDRQIISLGNKTIEFIYAPWVHWPETILSYLREDKILFPCDLFGSHLATSDLYATDTAKVYASAKRYYAEIMMPFRSHIAKHLEKIENLKIEMIAPSHGPVYHNPEFILNAYKEWVSDKVKNEVVIPFVSMHGSTRKMIDYFVNALIERNITVKPFNLIETDIGELAMALVDTATVVIGSPTVLTGPHPEVLYAVYLTNLLRPKLKFISVIGSYGWGGKMLEIITSLTNNLKIELIEPILIKGYPKTDDFKALERLADDILRRHQNTPEVIL